MVAHSYFGLVLQSVVEEHLFTVGKNNNLNTLQHVLKSHHL